jgi:hypothetical protein
MNASGYISTQTEQNQAFGSDEEESLQSNNVIPLLITNSDFIKLPEEVATDTSGEEILVHGSTDPSNHCYSHRPWNPPTPGYGTQQIWSRHIWYSAGME